MRFKLGLVIIFCSYIIGFYTMRGKIQDFVRQQMKERLRDAAKEEFIQSIKNKIKKFTRRGRIRMLRRKNKWLEIQRLKIEN